MSLRRAPCQASPYCLTLPLSFFDAGRLQLRTYALCLSMSLVVASALISAVLILAIILSGNLE